MKPGRYAANAASHRANYLSSTFSRPLVQADHLYISSTRATRKDLWDRCAWLCACAFQVELMECLIAAYARLMFVDGVFQADPHPGNLLLTKVRHLTACWILIDFFSFRVVCTDLLVAVTIGQLGACVAGLRSNQVPSYSWYIVCTPKAFCRPLWLCLQ